MRTLTLLCLLLACAPRTSTPQFVNRLGYTECTINGPVSWIRDDVLDSDLLAVVRAHEAKHVEQVRRFHNCHDFLVWFVPNMAEAEAEAFCASVRVDVAAGVPMDRAMVKYAGWLSRGYPQLRLGHSQALTLIARACS